MNSAEKQAEQEARKILRFTNIDSEAFTHSFKGVSITVQAGESYPGRSPECKHLAKHLAQKMLSREAKKDQPKNKPVKLWTPEGVEKLMGEILSPVGNESPSSTPTAEEARKKDLDNIKKEFVPETKEIHVEKKDVIASLKERGIVADEKKSKEELLAQLMKAEEDGVEVKEQPEESKTEK